MSFNGLIPKLIAELHFCIKITIGNAYSVSNERFFSIFYCDGP